MRIGILQCGQSPEALKDELGDYPDLFTRLLEGQGFDFRNWHVEAMDFPGDVHQADGWLLTGSRHGVYEDHAFIPPLEDFIRSAYAERVPMVGICFGHQIIAQALGGSVAKHPGGWSVGVQEYDFDGLPVRLNAWHQDQVIRPPADAQVAGCSDFCEYAALVYGERAFTVQAHPEFDDDFIEGLIRHRARGMVPQDLLEQAGRRMGQHKDAALLAGRIAGFFRRNAARQRGEKRTA